ncbi:MAG: DUF401 family protein [Chitinispirillaceae bacterium]|nr:DUF401 family protein [Chitinispirillaceae bacterium]
MPGQPDNRSCHEVSVDFFLSLPAIIKVGGSFCGILILHRLGFALGLTMIAATMILSLWSGTGIDGCVRVCGSLLQPQNVLLCTVILLLLLFNGALSSSGRMEKTIGAFRAWLKSDRLLYAGLPALIGLLPMPGGALFSAPLVAATDRDNRLSGSLKTAVNYWFRHIWEYWWPLYPGVILALQYCGLPLGVYFLIQMPFTAAAVLGGYFFLLRRIPHRSTDVAAGPLKLVDVFLTLAPIGVLVVLSVAGSAFLPAAGVKRTLANMYGMLLGLCSVIGWIAMSDRTVITSTLRILIQPATWSLMLVIAGVLMYSASLQLPIDGSGTTLVTAMRDEFLSLGVPFVLIAVIIPFVSGMVTGIAVAFVGASFPIVFALLGQQPPLHELIATTSLAFVAGHLGQMLSPVHICFLLTKEYFRTGLRATYRYLAGPAAVVTLAMALLCGGYYMGIR